jgi:23S rRNA pseudouridine1911/1915/1917 synthase
VEIPPEKTAHIIPQKMDLDIIYEDEYFIAVNKPAGLSVHPGAGVTENTLVNGLLYYTKNLSQVGGSERPGLIHRLDKDTTGVLLIAKTDEAHWKMSEQFAERKIYKEYHTLVWGTPNCKGLIDQTIGRSSSDRKKFTVRDSGKSAITEFSILENWKIISLLKIQLHTGRTHQIRVHMKYCNSPVVGDSTYGNDNGRIKGFSQQKKDICQQVIKQANRQFLHARKLKFIHPFTDKTVEILAPLPADFENAIKILQHNKELLIGY